MRTATILLLGFMLVACGGRSPNPIIPSLPSDIRLTCAEIEAELIAYHTDLAHYAIEKVQRKKWNIGFGIAGVLVWPLWFALDLEKAPEIEEKAIARRIVRLEHYSNIRKCNIERFQPTPEPKRKFEEKPSPRKERDFLKI